MKRYISIALTILVITLSSWTDYRPLNSNSWSISINKEVLLASWKNNDMGDTAIIDRKKIKLTDTLFAERFLCGNSGNNSIVTLIVKNNQNEIIIESINKDNGFSFISNIPFIDIFNSKNFNNCQMVTIYFKIESKTENINQTVLLGRLKLN